MDEGKSLELNDNKTGCMLFGATQQLQKVKINRILVGDIPGSPSAVVRNLGVSQD